jgi:uncharacterized protein YndB with AHSA1/START domain
MLKTILIVAVVALAGVLVYAAMQPDSFRVQRVATIDAPPDKVFPLIADFHRWEAWSPWEKRDPAMKRVHDGAASGRGAVYAWEGNRDVGRGRMEIVEATAPSNVAIRLDFIAPIEAHNVAEFKLIPRGNATDVVWSMHGPSPFLSRLVQVFVSMDRMVGKDFEAGLANLKALAER